MNGPDSWNRQGADAGQQSQRAANRSARGDACRRAFRRLRLFLVRKIFRGFVVGHQNGDVGLRESTVHQFVNPTLSPFNARIYSKHRCFLISHVLLLGYLFEPFAGAMLS